MSQKCKEFKSLFQNICEKDVHDSILLSGGLDSSILFCYLRPKNAITISIDAYSSDYHYSSSLSNKYPVYHHIYFPTMKDIFENIKELIKDYKTFDPIFLKNTVVQLLGFKEAAKLKSRSLILGDGADELFGGYNFLQNYVKKPEILKSKMDSLLSSMEFASYELSKKYTFNIFTPFLDKKIINFATRLSLNEKISFHNNKIYGKYFLRTCFSNMLGEKIAWREKEALEKGSGIKKIVSYLNLHLKDEEFINGIEKAKTEGVLIRNKEHLFYYKLYRNFFDPPGKDTLNQNLCLRKCHSCNSIFVGNGSFCKICGAYPVLFDNASKL